MNVWRVNRHSEASKFQQHSKLDNRRLLWHGTNIAVVAAILKAGLRIMPHARGRVGRGLYLANEQSKSAAYVTCGNKGKDLIGVCQAGALRSCARMLQCKIQPHAPPLTALKDTPIC